MIMCKYNYFYSPDELNKFALECGMTVKDSDMQPVRMYLKNGSMALCLKVSPNYAMCGVCLYTRLEASYNVTEGSA